jgi:pectate lyase
VVTGNETDDERPSLRSRWTLAVAVAASVLILGATVVWWQHREPAAGDPTVALPGPWEPPSAAATSPAAPESPTPARPPADTATVAPTPGRADRPGGTTAPPSTRPTRTTTPPAGPNLSLAANADADGDSKADGTRFGDVRDGDLGTFWSPTASTGEISVKFTGATTLARINIREATGGGRIGSWRVRNHDTGTVLATGSGAGVITFPATSLRKITFEILGASGTPRVAEFETFGA